MSYIEPKCIKENITKEWLLSNNFKYNRIFSDKDNDIYTYRFPVYKHNNNTILECEFIVALN